jgi:hypothetical protein
METATVSRITFAIEVILVVCANVFVGGEQCFLFV